MLTASIAQLVERTSYTRLVPGSSPGRRTFLLAIAKDSLVQDMNLLIQLRRYESAGSWLGHK